MRSINSFQNNQNHPYFASMNTNTQKDLSSLVSQYMDMFDPLKVNASLLQKRERQTVDNFYQNEVQKKVKTIMGSRDCAPISAIPNLASMLFHQNIPLNQSFQNIPLTEQLKLNHLRNLQQVQNPNFTINLQQEAFQLQSQLFNKEKNILNTLLNSQKPLKTMEEAKVKEEYVKQEEAPLSKGSPNLNLGKGKITECMSENNTTNDSLSEASADKNDFFMPSPIREEPVLAEYTKAFPDWDLATIFSFIKSGKSVDAFEKEKKFRMERKLKKQKANANKLKQNKAKKANLL